MMLKKIALWIMALTVALMGVNALAIPVHYEAGSLSAEAFLRTGAGEDEYEDEPEAIDVQDFHLLGATEDDSLLIFADGAYYEVDTEDMPEVIRQVGEGRIEALGNVENFETVGRNSKGDGAKALQEALIALGYLTGSADGQFGGKSTSAVSAFQRDMGLEETGEADALLQLLIASAREDVVNIVTDYDPAARYAPLAGKTQANLAAVAEYGLVLNLDDISGEGTLGNDAVVELDASGEADIDNCVFELEFALLVGHADDGSVTVTPGVQLRCESVRRPVMQELLLKSGDLRCTLPVGDLKTSLSGVKSVETGVAVLDADALQLLANAAEAGELKFRIGGKYNAFDGEVDEDLLTAVSNIGKAGQAL